MSVPYISVLTLFYTGSGGNGCSRWFQPPRTSSVFEHYPAYCTLETRGKLAVPFERELPLTLNFHNTADSKPKAASRTSGTQGKHIAESFVTLLFTFCFISIRTQQFNDQL